MNFQFAQGHNNSGNLAAFPYEPHLDRDIDFDVEYVASGVAKKIGGGVIRVQWDYLTQDELISLLQFFNVTHRNPSREGTFLLPDWYNIPSIWNGQVTIDTPRRNKRTGLFENITASFTGLAYLNA